MKKVVFAGLVLMLMCRSALAQLTLEDCLRMAHDNYPAVKKYNLLDMSSDYSLSNASKGYLPKISATAGADFFTDIIDKSSQLSKAGIDTKNHVMDASISIQQSIYDGGSIASQRRVIKAQNEVERQRLNVSMYKINERVEDLFFGVLLLDEQIKQNHLLQEDLAISAKTIKSMMKEGTANQSDMDAIMVEQVKARQTEGSLSTARSAYISMLGTFIGKPLDDDTRLVKPSYVDVLSNDNSLRPELSYYNAQQNLLKEERKSLNANLMPRLDAFAAGLYHSTVSDLVNNGFLAGGLTLSWNIGALYTRKNDLKKLDVQREQINADRETFLLNNRLEQQNSRGQIANLRKQIAMDDEIITLRESIRSKSEKKVQLGTETVNEMLRDINAVSEARQQKSTHNIQLLKELYNLKNINNN